VHELSKYIGGLDINTPIRILDVGCGDMALAKGLLDSIKGIELACVDIYPPPILREGFDPMWQHYQQFDGSWLPFEDRSFDIVIFSDVLHHVPSHMVIRLLESAARVGSFVLIKDHFEYGWFSRNMLRLMDFVGNFGYGVTVPKRYFTRDSFERIAHQSGIHIDEIHIGIRLYDHLPFVGLAISPEWQFVAICSTIS
jgi:SAM-dependent methyltransferase